MILKQQSRLVRWTYFLRKTRKVDQYSTDGHYTGYELQKYPISTTLCRLFWRAFVFMPLFWLVVAVAIGWPTYELAKFVLNNTMAFLTALLMGVALFACITGGIALCGTYWNSIDRALLRGGRAIANGLDHTVDAIEESVFWQGLKALKSKMCPIIRID